MTNRTLKEKVADTLAFMESQRRDVIMPREAPTDTVDKEDIKDVLWQLLDDMGKDGLCVCGAAKEDLINLYEELWPDEPESELPSALEKQ